MFEITLRIKTIDDVYYLTSVFRSMDCDMDIMTAHRKHVVDAKSVLGILSLDLSEPVILKAYTDDPELINSLKEALGKFGRNEEALR